MKLLPTLIVTDGGAVQNDPTGTGWHATYNLSLDLIDFEFHPNATYWMVCDAGDLQEITPDGMHNGLQVSLDIHLGNTFRLEARFSGTVVGETIPSDNFPSYSGLL